jgi:RHS repeat-associated protein
MCFKSPLTEVGCARTCCLYSTYGFDNLNRLTSIAYNVGTTGVTTTPGVTLTYDQGGASANAMGRLTSMTDGVGSETYSYNNLGQTTQLQKVINGTTYTTGYQYNLAGELSQITYPSGRIVLQNYDAIGRLCSVGASGSTCASGTNYASGFAYNAAFQATGFNYGNGVAATFGYTPDRLLLQSLAYTKGATTLFSTNYWYKTDSTNCPTGASGNNGQIQCITDSVDSGRTAAYSYDSLYRLTSAVTNGSANYVKWGISWTYDRYGNALAETQTYDSPAHFSVSVDATTNRLTGSPYAYDANGNMTNDGNNTLVYDAENRLLSATNGGASGTYTYDGNNLRVQKLSGSTTTVYIFSGSKVIAEYSGTSAPYPLSREYIYSGGALLAKIESGATKYYHQDHLSNRLVTDSNGNTLAQLGHYPFGESWYNASSDKLQFTTYERDSESGNDYAIARSYVNRLARFSSPDPLSGGRSNPQSLNRYAYVTNAPQNYTDPMGKSKCFPIRFWKELSMGGCGGGGGWVSEDAILSVFTFGNDIFDALAGAPGTYTRTDIHGNLSWGFSPDLWATTVDWIDQATAQLKNDLAKSTGSDPSQIQVTWGGFQVDIQDLGTGQTISGFIPEKIALESAFQNVVAGLPERYQDIIQNGLANGMSLSSILTEVGLVMQAAGYPGFQGLLSEVRYITSVGAGITPPSVSVTWSH